MKKSSHLRSLSIFLVMLLSSIIISASECSIRKVARIPAGSESGHIGVADAFIGNIDNVIIIAGGSDYPAGRLWENGRKHYYDDIYLLIHDRGKYVCRKAGVKFPAALANGCCASIGKTIFCFGGKNAQSYSSAIYTIKLSGSAVRADSIGVSPEGFIPVAAVAHKGDIYVHGVDGEKNRLYKFSVSSHKWKELAACPDRRISEQSRLIYQHNGREEAIYLMGGRGSDKDGNYYSSKVWEYLPAHDVWNRKNDIMLDGRPVPMAAFAAARFGSGHILVFGGDDCVELLKRTELEEAIRSSDSPGEREKLKARLKEHFISHKGFSNKILAYHTITDTWILLDTLNTSIPVATYAVKEGSKVIIPTGERAPGVRDNAIYEITVNDNVSFGVWNYTVLIIYLLAMMGVGFYFSKKADNTEQFFKGNSQIPWWAAGISIFATALSAITFLSIPAKAYMADWGMFMFNMAILLIVPVVTRFYLPFFRKLNAASAYEYLEQRFSPPVRYLASLFFNLFMFARVAIVLFLPSLALNAVTGLNIYLCILLMGLVTIAYCTMGGIEAVIWGDVIQGVILVGGALASLVCLICGIDGGIGTMIDVAVGQNKFNILDFSFEWTRPVIWVTLIGGLANQLLTYTSDQSVIQRYITVKDMADTKKGLWLNGLLSVPIALIFFSIGTGLYVFFRCHPEMLSVGMNNTDSIFPHFMMCKLPTGIAGLLIAAVFAAAMSTLSANINSTSTVMTEDFYAKFCKNVTDRQKMRFARWTGVILGLFGIAMAVLLAAYDIASLWDQFNFFLGLFTSGLGGLFMMGIFIKRIGTRSALTGFAASIAVLLLFNSRSHVSVIMYGAIGLASCCLFGYLSSFIWGYNK